MYFWLKIETEMLKYENYLYKLSIFKKSIITITKKLSEKKGKNIQKETCPINS